MCLRNSTYTALCWFQKFTNFRVRRLGVRGLGLQPNNLLLITVDNHNTILLITQGAADGTHHTIALPVFHPFYIIYSPFAFRSRPQSLLLFSLERHVIFSFCQFIRHMPIFEQSFEAMFLSIYKRPV